MHYNIFYAEDNVSNFYMTLLKKKLWRSGKVAIDAILMKGVLHDKIQQEA